MAVDLSYRTLLARVSGRLKFSLMFFFFAVVSCFVVAIGSSNCCGTSRCLRKFCPPRDRPKAKNDSWRNFAGRCCSVEPRDWTSELCGSVGCVHFPAPPVFTTQKSAWAVCLPDFGSFSKPLNMSSFVWRIWRVGSPAKVPKNQSEISAVHLGYPFATGENSPFFVVQRDGISQA